jgi:uncharacterized protein YjbI with pentapeptide repeats
MALGLLTSHRGDEPDVSRPSIQRAKELEDAYTNATDSDAPFRGIEIRTLGDVLQILCTRSWAGDLTPATPPSVLRRARWFTESRVKNRAATLVQANFSGADFTGANLRYADLHGALLSRASLPEADLRDADLLGAELTGAWLTGARFSRTRLIDDTRMGYIERTLQFKKPGDPFPCEGMALQSRAELIWLFLRQNWSGEPDARGFARANLRGIDLRAIDLTGADLTGANLDDTDAAQTLLIEQTRMNELRRSASSNLVNGDMPYKGIEISNANELRWILAEEARRSSRDRGREEGADIRGADLSACQLCRSDLRRGRLVDATLQSQTTPPSLQGAVLDQCDLRGIDLTDAHMEHTSLVGAKIQQARLDGAHLRNANLGSADLTDAIMVGADLSDADLGAAILHGADLSFTNLSGATLVDARTNADTYLANVKLDERTRVKGISWDSISLYSIPWPDRLGDEREIANAVGRRQKAGACREVAHVYSALAIALQEHGFSNLASQYRLRGFRLERHAEIWEWNSHWWKLPGWLVLNAVDLLTGYGEQPIKAVAAYFLTFSVFAFGYYVIPMLNHDFATLTVQQAVWYSWVALIGRGFSPRDMPFGDFGQGLGMAEATIGLFLEAIVVAILARLFLRS